MAKKAAMPWGVTTALIRRFGPERQRFASGRRQGSAAAGTDQRGPGDQGRPVGRVGGPERGRPGGLPGAPRVQRRRRREGRQGRRLERRRSRRTVGRLATPREVKSRRTPRQRGRPIGRPLCVPSFVARDASLDKTYAQFIRRSPPGRIPDQEVIPMNTLSHPRWRIWLAAGILIAIAIAVVAVLAYSGGGGSGGGGAY